MERNGELRIAVTNQDYRKITVNTAFETMKSNQREYSKQSNLYIPKSIGKIVMQK
jgi:hypothetical protein